MVIHSLPISKWRKESTQKLVVSYPLNTTNMIIIVSWFCPSSQAATCSLALPGESEKRQNPMDGDNKSLIIGIKINMLLLLMEIKKQKEE